LLALSGLLFGLVGIWQPHTIRWYVPLCGIAMLIFWFGAAMAE